MAKKPPRLDDEPEELLPGWPEDRVKAMADNLLGWLERFGKGDAELKIEPVSTPAGQGWSVRLG